MAFEEKHRVRFRSGMGRRIADLRTKIEDSLDFAIENIFEDRVDTYFKVEEGFVEIDRMLSLIEADLDDVLEFTYAQRLESRLEYIEDRFEDFDSEMRQRPRRRRRKINLFNFFKTAGGRGTGSDPTSSRGEIQSALQAYEALELEFGSSLATVTRAFRQRVKKLHPDSRKGDRSFEPELRRIIEAYQYLKDDLTIQRTDPQKEF